MRILLADVAIQAREAGPAVVVLSKAIALILPFAYRRLLDLVFKSVVIAKVTLHDLFRLIINLINLCHQVIVILVYLL